MTAAEPDVSPAARHFSLAIVSHFAYGAISGGTSGHIGGVERQTALMARWLAQRGHRVSVLTWDEGQPDDQVIDGVRVIKICRRNAGLYGLRFFSPRWTSLSAALTRANSEIYYHNLAEAVTGQVALWVRRNRRRFVYSVATDVGCDPSLPGRNFRERVLYRYGLAHANTVVVQTETQSRMLAQGFGLDSVVLPMPCPGPEPSRFVVPTPPIATRPTVVWLARVTRSKRPDRLLWLAENYPEIEFQLVGPSDGSPFVEAVLSRARQIRNLTVVGAVPRERIPEVLSAAHCLCSTSDFEGFPNTYLEAWSEGLPVAALFDPDGLIAKKGLGVSATSVEDLGRALKKLLWDEAAYRAASVAGRDYYLQNHTVAVSMARFETLFRQQADAMRESPRRRR